MFKNRHVQIIISKTCSKFIGCRLCFPVFFSTFFHDEASACSKEKYQNLNAKFHKILKSRQFSVVLLLRRQVIWKCIHTVAPDMDSRDFCISRQPEFYNRKTTGNQRDQKILRNFLLTFCCFALKSLHEFESNQKIFPLLNEFCSATW